MDQRNLLTKALRIIQAQRHHRWWRRAVTGMAAVVVFMTVYLLILPALTMEHGAFEVEPVSLEAAPGETINTEVYAAADNGREETFFVLSADGDNAGLDESRIDFDSDGTAVITDQNGLDIELHREYTEDGETRCWFVLEKGQSASFLLPWVNGMDRYRSEVTAEEVPLQPEQQSVETESQDEFTEDPVPETLPEKDAAPDESSGETASPEQQEEQASGVPGQKDSALSAPVQEEPAADTEKSSSNQQQEPETEGNASEQTETALQVERISPQEEGADGASPASDSGAAVLTADSSQLRYRAAAGSDAGRNRDDGPAASPADSGETEYETVYHTETILEQAGDRDQGGALTLAFGQGSSLEAALGRTGDAIALTWEAEDPLLEASADAAGEETDDSSDKSSHDFSENITNVIVSKLENGQWVPSTEFTDGDNVRMEIHYTIPQKTVGAGNQTIHYQLPEGIHLAQQEQGTVYDGQTPVGTYTITTDGLITIVFNNNYADDKSFTGQIQFQGTVSAQQGQEDTKINFGAGGTITVKPNSKPTDVRADKSGSYNEEDEKLHYTIEVTTTKGTGSPITVKDSFQSGNTSATYDTDSFQIIKVDANGQETAINGYTPDITSGGGDGAPQQFTITDLPALEAGESYRITYTAAPGKTSNINGYSDVSNYVTTTTTGGDSGSDWNQVVISQNMIGKWGNYDSAAGAINWTITINPDKRNISGYILSDTITTSEGITANIPSNVTLTGSNGSTQTITLPYTFPDGSKDTYTITYQTKVEGLDPGESASVTNDAHLTHEDDDYKAESTVWPQGQDFSSSKSYGWHDGAQDTGSTGTYQWNASITVPSSVSNEALGRLTFTDTIHDLVASDGSEVEDSHYITAQQLGAMTVNVNGTALDRGTDYQICDTNGTAITELTGDTTYAGFQIQFTEAALTKIQGQTISFSYSTTVDYTKLADGASYTIRNTGGIPGHESTPETGYHKPGQLEKQAKGSDQWGNETWLDNGASLDFEASKGVIHYRLLLHTGADTKGDLTVKDILPSGASLVVGSYYLRFYYNDNYQTDSISWNDANGSQTYIAANNFNVVSETSDGTTTLTFTVKDGYNNDGKANTLAIYYDVSIAKDPIWADNPGLEEHLYTNRASWGDNEATTDVTVERDVPKLEKTGAQLPQYDENGNPMTGSDGKELMSNTVRYTVFINPAAQDLDPNADVLQLVDTFGNLPSGVTGADLNIDSVKLYLYDADTADHLGSELSNARYSYIYDSDGRVLTFTIPDSMGLVLVYDYTIDRGTAAGGLTLSNSVELTGVAGSKTEDQTQLVETSSSATATKRTLTIYKVDGTNYGHTLSGAQFKLQQFNTEYTKWEDLADFTTDKNGVIVLSRADDEKYENFNFEDDTLYQLIETTAPSGYAKDDTPYYFVWLKDGSAEQSMEQTISAAGISKNDVLFINDSSAIYVPNEPTTLTVQKVWTDQDSNETAPGAESVQVQLYQQAMISDAWTVTIISQGNGGENPVTETIHVKKGTGIDISFVNANEYMTVTINRDSIIQSGTETFNTGKITDNTTINIYSSGNWTYSFDKINLSYTIPEEPSPGKKTPYGEAVILNAGNGWSYTWTNLDKNDENGNPCYYTVEETKVPGYSVIYSSNNQNGIQTGQLVITNRASGYILPETGGAGTTLFTTGGLALMVLAGLMYKILRRKGDEAP